MKRALALAALLAACGGSKKTTDAPAVTPDAAVADPIPAALRAETEAAIALVEAMATAASGAGDDCAAVAVALRPIADGPNGKAIVTIDADPDQGTYAKALNDAYGTQLDAASDHLGEAVGPCSYDPAVTPILIETGIIQPDPSAAEPDPEGD